MKSNYDVLGNYIRLIDTRNKDNVEIVMGRKITFLVFQFKRSLCHQSQIP